ncbi:hypothetical protein [Actinomadura rupiterrae]|uniref:hypothetical protein n=1 Tax=Actinomadura rupiterrae TaxID=559627 RepID=UPI0020A5850F|nr:hypothetical protein [Actinomadura rupiterrae]MCP2337133.1 hypothetical protein [Actinomadura rupiterrae]
MGGYPGWNYEPGPYGGYGPGGYGPYEEPASQGAAITGLVLNSVLAVLCCGVLAIPGIITGAFAVSNWQTNPRLSRTLNAWTWVIFGLNVAIMLVLFLILLSRADSTS